MARKPNYDYEKRRKEAERKAKKDAKREDRLRRKEEGGGDEIELQRFDEYGMPIDESEANDEAALVDDPTERG